MCHTFKKIQTDFTKLTHKNPIDPKDFSSKFRNISKIFNTP